MTATSDGLLAAARGGDERAFEALIAPLQPDLLALCYRMLGSVHDAQDAVQETLVRAWRGLESFEARSALRTWLNTVATNVCLREIERRARRVIPLDLGPAATDPRRELGAPLTELAWLEPFPDARLVAEWAPPEARYERKESIELAFVAALQHLPALQRAVLIMRDVLAFSAAEAASSLGVSTASVNSALQRARSTVDARLPGASQQSTRRALGDERVREMVTGFVDAWERSDVQAVVSLLTEDVVMTMPPLSAWYSGRDDVEAFLRARPLQSALSWRVLITSVNGQPATAHYLWDAAAGRFLAHSISVLSFSGDRISALDSFLDAELLPACGLPAELPAA